MTSRCPKSILPALIASALIGLGLAASESAFAMTLAEQNEAMFKRLQEVHGLSAEQMTKVKEIFARSGWAGQGNPDVTKHPMTPGQCADKLQKAGISYENKAYEKICGGKFMAPLYDPTKQKPDDAKACIDQFEFPDIPCDYPAVWVKAKEAAEICEVMGKRLCDAHEWEGACAGSLDEPDYEFAAVKGLPEGTAQQKMRALHNTAARKTKSWAYGPAFKTGVCAQSSTKDANCNGGNYKNCGSNTYPSGSFPGCTSKLEVYDIHGNAAEHMNLPLAPDQMTSTGSKKLGVTEMKGSWFIWDKFQAHEDWCRWRAPYWHGSRVLDDHSHHNYHLGFRCCKNTGK